MVKAVHVPVGGTWKKFPHPLKAKAIEEDIRSGPRKLLKELRRRRRRRGLYLTCISLYSRLLPEETPCNLQDYT